MERRASTMSFFDPSTHMAVITRQAQTKDLPAIVEIYNQSVNTMSTFDTETRTVEDQQAWLENRQKDRHPVLVAITDDDIVVGWGSLSPYSNHRVYDQACENQVYVHRDYQGRGVGKALMIRLLARAEAAGLHTVIAKIAGDNDAAVHLHESLGFERSGILHEIGCKYDTMMDVLLMQRRFGQYAPVVGKLSKLSSTASNVMQKKKHNRHQELSAEDLHTKEMDEDPDLDEITKSDSSDKSTVAGTLSCYCKQPFKTWKTRHATFDGKTLTIFKREGDNAPALTIDVKDISKVTCVRRDKVEAMEIICDGKKTIWSGKDVGVWVDRLNKAIHEEQEAY